MTDPQTRVAEALGHWEQKLVRYVQAHHITAWQSIGQRDAGVAAADANLGAARDQLAFALSEMLKSASSSSSETPLKSSGAITE